MIRTLVLLLPILCLALSCASSDSAPPARAAASLVVEEGHLLLTLELDSPTHTARVVDARLVHAPLPRLRAEEAQPWALVLEGADGAVLYEVGIPRADLVRGAFHGDPSGNASIARSRFAFSVRLPLVSGAAQVRILAGATLLAALPMPEVSR